MYKRKWNQQKVDFKHLALHYCPLKCVVPGRIFTQEVLLRNAPLFGLDTGHTEEHELRRDDHSIKHQFLQKPNVSPLLAPLSVKSFGTAVNIAHGE